MPRNTKTDAAGPARTKRNSGDTKGYPEENPGRRGAQTGKAAKQHTSAEDIGTRRKKTVR